MVVLQVLLHKQVPRYLFLGKKFQFWVQRKLLVKASQNWTVAYEVQSPIPHQHGLNQTKLKRLNQILFPFLTGPICLWSSQPPGTSLDILLDNVRSWYTIAWNTSRTKLLRETNKGMLNMDYNFLSTDRFFFHDYVKSY